MKKTTWTGNIVNGKVLPTKAERTIPNEVISAMMEMFENNKGLSL